MVGGGGGVTLQAAVTHAVCALMKRRHRVSDVCGGRVGVSRHGRRRRHRRRRRVAFSLTRPLRRRDLWHSRRRRRRCRRTRGTEGTRDVSRAYISYSDGGDGASRGKNEADR